MFLNINLNFVIKPCPFKIKINFKTFSPSIQQFNSLIIIRSLIFHTSLIKTLNYELEKNLEISKPK